MPVQSRLPFDYHPSVVARVPEEGGVERTDKEAKEVHAGGTSLEDCYNC